MAQALEKTTVEVAERTNFGKNACRRYRAAGDIPANVYGMDLPPFSVSVKARRISEVLHLSSGQNTIITLAMSGADVKRAVMIRDLQRDPVTDRVIHVDFVRVDASKTMQVSVPVRLLGTATGVKDEGGTLDFVHREISIECLPAAIPEHVDVDVSELHVGQHVSVEDLQAQSKGVTILDDPATIIATVAAARVEEVVETEEGADEAAPEVAEPDADSEK